MKIHMPGGGKDPFTKTRVPIASEESPLHLSPLADSFASLRSSDQSWRSNLVHRDLLTLSTSIRSYSVDSRPMGVK